MLSRPQCASVVRQATHIVMMPALVNVATHGTVIIRLRAVWRQRPVRRVTAGARNSNARMRICAATMMTNR